MPVVYHEVWVAAESVRFKFRRTRSLGRSLVCSVVCSFCRLQLLGERERERSRLLPVPTSDCPDCLDYLDWTGLAGWLVAFPFLAPICSRLSSSPSGFKSILGCSRLVPAVLSALPALPSSDPLLPSTIPLSRLFVLLLLLLLLLSPSRILATRLSKSSPGASSAQFQKPSLD